MCLDLLPNSFTIFLKELYPYVGYCTGKQSNVQFEVHLRLISCIFSFLSSDTSFVRIALKSLYSFCEESGQRKTSSRCRFRVHEQTTNGPSNIASDTEITWNRGVTWLWKCVPDALWTPIPFIGIKVLKKPRTFMKKTPLQASFNIWKSRHPQRYPPFSLQQLCYKNDRLRTQSRLFLSAWQPTLHAGR